MSVQLRHELLTRISQVLDRPEDHGDRFFVQIVRNSPDGFVPITLLRNMVAEFSNIPAGYFEHIADKEPDRLEISIDRSKVRIPRQDQVDNQLETNAYGVEDAPPSTEEQRGQEQLQTPNKSLHFRPYTPRFSRQQLVHPVYYSNGKFFSDQEPERRPRLDRPAMQVPPYEKPEIDPLGDAIQKDAGTACWNCGKADHSFRECPEPRDDFAIREHRKKTKQKTPSFGRFFVELELRNKVANLAPGRLSDALQDALGMNGLHPEPPYYPRMREQGYPPGYWSSPTAQGTAWIKRSETGWSEHLLFHDAPDLAIYTDPAIDTNKQDLPKQADSKVKLVHYPGLENNAPPPPQQQQQQEQHHYNESIQSWNAYFESLPLEQQQHYYNYYYGYTAPAQQISNYPPVAQYQQVQPTAAAHQPLPHHEEPQTHGSDDDMDVSDGD